MARPWWRRLLAQASVAGRPHLPPSLATLESLVAGAPERGFLRLQPRAGKNPAPVSGAQSPAWGPFRLTVVLFSPRRVFFLNVPLDSVIERLTLRRIDPVTGERLVPAPSRRLAVEGSGGQALLGSLPCPSGWPMVPQLAGSGETPTEGSRKGVPPVRSSGQGLWTLRLEE